ncbi:hypothetical protein BOTBODRAFT_608303 [Botryobasidium botryosum FD-172 SS1]|uniref:Uncharacterized protein n=1 Tax=Botryobasidium botryosum (strain FD-172 SS1) TaxID=930990 RepID=A0A067M6P9_BOTB1|nr:hypothetical protein BOTBODRAFT_608303 [Botryobasidium botryosum FD-172 SS1]
MMNALGQNPCLVAAYLFSQCANQPWSIAALPPGSTASYPNPPQQYANLCQCNTVAYDLISACSVCQDHNVIQWVQWIQNCPANLTFTGIYTEVVPSQTSIPSYAYWDPTVLGFFNVTAAHALATEPPKKSDRKKMSIIFGAVFGGLGFLIIVSSLVVVYLIVRRSRRPPPNPAPTLPPPSRVTSPLMAPVMTIYDPDDPSTFPPPLTLPGWHVEAPAHQDASAPNPPQRRYSLLDTTPW